MSDKFLSTPSARRATGCSFSSSMPEIDFYPRPPRGGRLKDDGLYVPTPEISIHALREEGDSGPAGYIRRNHRISIHALREEGDKKSMIS